ncbi:MAG: signal peptidase II [Longimicrobiales bacterium]
MRRAVMGAAGERRGRRALAVAVIILAVDLLSKRWALLALAYGETERLLGLVPLTLAFNTGLAFGFEIQGVNRGVLLLMTTLILALLIALLRAQRPGDPYRWIGVGLVCGGATGNLYDRLRWTGGVVDFFGPVDLGFMLWPIFNVADMSITTGALFLAASIGWEERRGGAVAVGPEAAVTRVDAEQTP